jgi:HD-GYP domain-containing protein (c-di-GMP phosphodiesterase class II)
MTIYQIKMLQELLPGEILLHPIYRSDGLLFLNRYKSFTDSILINIKNHFPSSLKVLIVTHASNLNEFENLHIYKHESFLNDLEMVVQQFATYSKANLTINDYKDERALNDPISTSNTFHRFHHSPLWNNLQRLFDSTHLLNRIPQIKELIFSTLEKEEALESLYIKLINYHDVLKIHSKNTAIISLMLGLTLELTDEELVDLFISTLFADIGFTKYPKSDFVLYLDHGNRNDMLLSHIKDSMEIISNSPFCRRKNVIMGILDHHERVDGLGFPSGKSARNIHLFGRIIAIAQKYDELVGGYIKGDTLASYPAITYIWEQKGTMFDRQIIKTFLNRTTIFKLNEPFLLPNYPKGVIVGFQDYLNHPVLPMVKDETGNIRDLYMERIKDTRK